MQVHHPQITSQKPLYQQCLNKLTVEVPSLGAEFNPVYKASEAQVISSASDKNVVFLVPTGDKAVLDISSLQNGQMLKLDNFTFNVILPPPPKIIFAIGEKDQSGKPRLPKTGFAYLKVKSDPTFQKAYPKDARYLIPSLKVFTQEGSAPKKMAFKVAGYDNVKGLEIDLAKLKALPAGTKVFIVADQIERKTFQNNPVKLNWDEAARTIEATLK
jgi:hypothetical protein